MTHETGSATLGSRVAAELKHYAVLSLYLFVCFAAILLYRAAVLDDARIPVAAHGVALVKALVLAKFMMLGEAARAGERVAPMRPVLAILYRSLVFLAVLVGLTAVEEVVAGAIHGLGPVAALTQAMRDRWDEVAASCLLLWLILLPYFAFAHLAAALGEAEVRRLFLARRPGGGGTRG